MGRRHRYDAVIVGSGPNGLTAAIVLQKAGLSTQVIEGKSTIGGGTRSAELTRPGFIHDICSAVHPLAAASEVFRQMPLDQFGLEWVQPNFALAHPFDDGDAASISNSLSETAAHLGEDADAYHNLFAPLAANWSSVSRDLLGPVRLPQSPLASAAFGIRAIRSAHSLAVRTFQTSPARALFAGMAAHSFLPLNAPGTAAFGLVLGTLAHVEGWPFARGGSQRIADALAGYYRSLGGEIQTDYLVKSLRGIPPSRAILFDLTPRQLLTICGDQFSSSYRRSLERYRYGSGVFKVDWALSEPVPFQNPQCRKAGTVHLGGTLEEIAAAEAAVTKGFHPDQPFVIFAQPTIRDPARAPAGGHTAWAYCHVPADSTVNRTEEIEAQIERFAPGFRDVILDRHTFNAVEMETYNPNYVGGDINGGAHTLSQMFTRPAPRACPYSTSLPHVFLCSASTPPGGGVHGLCGSFAAQAALQRVFGIRQ